MRDILTKTKHVIPVLILIFLGIGITQYAYSQEKEVKVKYNLKISGMTCGKCDEAVEKALSNLQGIEKVSPDYKKGECSVEASDMVCPFKMKEAIEKIGFKVKEVKLEF